MRFYIYDLETYFNCFLFTGKFEGASESQCFEISTRTNDRHQLMSWLSYLQNLGDVQMVGYNNLGFDYPIIHELLNNQFAFDYTRAYNLAQEIIQGQAYGKPQQYIGMRERIIPQIDLVKINHFDNKNKRTRLKDLQFAMRSTSVEDLPFDFRKPMEPWQMDQLRKYNLHDVSETEIFLGKCKHLIQMRQELLNNGVLSGDVLNYSDVKIGTEFLIRKIGRQKCFVSGSKPKQTYRQEIKFAEIILPQTKFRTEEFNATLEWFRAQVAYPTAETPYPKYQASHAGLEFFFGVGGVHASVEGRVFKSTDTHVVKDIDVSGMYVAVAIANGFYPEHLGQDFVHAYRQLQSDRKQYPKGSAMNATLKLAGNGAYGNSNNQYSPFYDTRYTFSVTVNGQLQLLQLVELLSLVPGVQLIQANTDGITALVPRAVERFFDLWCREWEAKTGLKLEEVEYSAMWIRDVNNYVAMTTDGKLKRKGAYWYPLKDSDYDGVWNKDFSNMASIKAVSLVMQYGVTAEEAIRCVTDPFDFMLRYKTTGDNKVYIAGELQQKTLRYYISKAGGTMNKIAPARGPVGTFKRKNSLSDSEYNKVLAVIPPGTWDERIHTKNRSVYEQNETGIEKGWKVKECNIAAKFNWSDVDFDYYVNETKKLIIGEKNV